ncbi:MAG: Gfo/Idh/MocA family oxidoreductase [Acidobacteria bacterium]|nr:Gfo/Idh/MocA family oxidoreductase [Acidobacteriota bacterium]MBI3428039.1 Gfo/Idh/MocA family oxidoreductase [Acidobacteriota bacterium]
MKTIIRCTLLLALSGFFAVHAAAQTAEIKIGIIGTDTSHVPAFTKLLNDKNDPNHIPGARVVAAFKGGSADVESSRTRVDNYAAEIKEKYGVELVNSIEELCQRVDAVLLESVDGRPHLNQVRPVLKAGKRVFLDKPFAASYADAREIVRLARAANVAFFSSSSLRYSADVQAIRNSDKHGGITGAFAYGPENFEPHHPDLFWYGIHAVEMLYTLMGPGCETVTRVKSEGGDTVTGKWKDGRLGTMRGITQGKQDYGAVAFGVKATLTTPSPLKVDYRPLLVEIIKFFQTGVPPIQPEETLEVMAFMEAADLSKARGGVPVLLKEVTEQKK